MMPLPTEKEYREHFKAQGVTGVALEKMVFDRRKKGGFSDLKDAGELTETTEAGKLKNWPGYAERKITEAKQKAYQQESPAGRFVAGAGRFAYGAIPGTGNPDEMRSFDESSQGDPYTMAGKLAPELGITLAGGAALSGATGAGAIGNGLLRSGAQGLAYGLPSTLLHQSQNMAEGQGFQPAEAATEMAMSAALPMAGNALGNAMKGRGVKIAQTALKSNTKIAGAKTLTKEQAETYLKRFGSLKGLKGSEAKMEKVRQQLGQEFDHLIKRYAAGKIINVGDAIATAENNVDALAQAAKVNLDDVPIIKAQLNNFKKQIASFADKQGRAGFEAAQGFKTKTLDEVAQYAKKSPGVFNPELSGKAQGARATRAALNEQMVVQEPRLGPLNAQYKEMAQIEPFMDAALERQMANRGLSMQDLITLGSGAAGAGGLAAAGISPKYWALTVLPFLASRAQKSPAIAKALYGTGSSLANQSTLRDIIAQLGRSGMAESDILK